MSTNQKKKKIRFKVKKPPIKEPSVIHTELSKSITSKLSSKEKRENGIFFTPQDIIIKMLNIIKNINITIETVLEPSCGSCEFINSIDKHFTGLDITGVELNDTIYNDIKDLTFNNKVNIVHSDFLTWSSINTTKYDLIIGNPPFFVKKRSDVDKRYYKYFDGRPNIYILFIIEALNKLNENGILAFVVPSNFTNCLYYDKLRKHIYNKFTIIDIVSCTGAKYIDTTQDTYIFIVQNIPPLSNDKFTLQLHQYSIFNTPSVIQELIKITENSTNLSELMFDVNVGNVVWNACKDILKNEDTYTRLIYSSDIVDKKLSIKTYTDRNPAKKNYIDKEGRDGVLLVLNRGYGVGQYDFNYCIIDVNYPYLIENHLICVGYMGSKITDSELKEKYTKIVASFENEKTKKFIKLYFGNSAINTTELKYILPIYKSET
jgi:type I restriction-modification system DNA methylase subunit